MGRPLAQDITENAPPGGMPPMMTDGLPVMSGRVSLVCADARGGRARRTPVLLKVHRSTFGGCYAVLAPDKGAAIKDCGAVSLRNCSVNAVPGAETPATEHHFRIVASDREGASLTFSVPSERELNRWIQDLTLMTSSSADRKRLPLRAIAQRRPMSPMPGHVRRKGVSPASLPALEEEED